MKIWKSESNSVYDNILYKYKNVFNINKWLKMTFIAKRKYYNKLKTFVKIHIYIYIYIKKGNIFFKNLNYLNIFNINF